MSNFARCTAATLLALTLLAACGGDALSPAAPPPAATSPIPSSQAAAPGTTGVASEPTAPSAPTAAPTSAAAAPAPAAAAPPDASPPLTPEEQKKLEKTCKPLVSAMQRAAQKAGPGTNPLDVFAALVKSPPKMPAADLTTCSALLERSIRDYLGAAIETEARVTLKRISLEMAAAFEAEHAFCPATTTPVPASAAGLDKTPYVSTSTDWAAPTWRCLHFDMTGQRQRFQYEVRADPGGAWVEAIARGAPRGDGRIIEIVQRVQVKGNKLELPPMSKR